MRTRLRLTPLAMIPIALPLLLGAPPPAAADSIRGIVAAEVLLPAESGVQRTADIGLEEIAVVYPQGNLQFLQGIEVQLLLTNTLKKYFDSFAVAVYKAVSPKPQAGVRSYQGERILLQYLPYQNRIWLHVPVVGASLAAPLTTGTFQAEKPVALGEFPLLIRMIPLAKGIPEAAAESRFHLMVKPLLSGWGLFELKIIPPEAHREAPRPFEVTIDGRPVNEVGKVREMEAGIHQLRIRSSAYREVDAAFTIEPGRRSTMEIQLEEPGSSIGFDLPPEAEVYLDGTKVRIQPKQRLPLKEGEHTIRIKVNGYNMSKKFVVEGGNCYEISLIFDIIILEN